MRERVLHSMALVIVLGFLGICLAADGWVEDSGITWTNNKVGIGTQSSMYYLDLKKTGDHVLHLGNHNGNDLSVDIAGGQGLANIVVGAVADDVQNVYNYSGSRGASRIQFNDGKMNFFVSDGQGGQTVNWVTGLSINNTGEVGIGTSNQESALDIVSSSQKIFQIKPQFGNHLFRLVWTNDGNRLYWVPFPNGTADWSKEFSYDFIDERWEFGTGLYIHDNVGIGTTTPDEMLTVKGNIHCREIKVTATAGADFVFLDGYDLTALNEVEDHIKTYKHLPDIPSAEEVEANGVNLGEMQARHLQKIEELTLYVIELNKKLEAQIEKNNELEERLAKVEGQVRSN
ncbi:hypothetical protein JW835_09855 [bacterium]|nr:hypothetical protein [bacterium]